MVHNFEDEFKGRDPGEGRLIAYAHDDGKIYDMSITSFVILQTARAIQRTGVPTDAITADIVSEHSLDCANALVEDGWFTAEEYEAAWAAEEAAHLDDELRDVIE